MADVTELDEALEARRKKVLADQPAPGNGREVDHVQVDYFGAGTEHTVTLPDGVSTMTHKTLMEGDKRKYMNAVNRDLKINRKSQDATLKLAPGDDREALLRLAIVGWSLIKDGAPVPFTPQNLGIVLDKFPPDVLDVVEKDIRKHNAWLLAEISIEDIDEEIKNLTELREQKVAESEGNGGSSS